MKQPRRDAEREQRISMEIVVDAYGLEEQAMGWYSYLEDQLCFPFLATCSAKRAISPLQVGDEVEDVGMAPDEECRVLASTRPRPVPTTADLGMAAGQPDPWTLNQR